MHENILIMIILVIILMFLYFYNELNKLKNTENFTTPPTCTDANGNITLPGNLIVNGTATCNSFISGSLPDINPNTSSIGGGNALVTMPGSGVYFVIIGNNLADVNCMHILLVICNIGGTKCGYSILKSGGVDEPNKPGVWNLIVTPIGMYTFNVSVTGYIAPYDKFSVNYTRIL